MTIKFRGKNSFVLVVESCDLCSMRDTTGEYAYEPRPIRVVPDEIARLLQAAKLCCGILYEFGIRHHFVRRDRHCCKWYMVRAASLRTVCARPSKVGSGMRTWSAKKTAQDTRVLLHGTFNGILAEIRQ